MQALRCAMILLMAAASAPAGAEDDVAQARRLFDRYVALGAASDDPMPPRVIDSRAVRARSALVVDVLDTGMINIVKVLG